MFGRLHSERARLQEKELYAKFMGYLSLTFSIFTMKVFGRLHNERARLEEKE